MKTVDGYEVNEAGDPRPWSPREVQLHEDIIAKIGPKAGTDTIPSLAAAMGKNLFLSDPVTAGLGGVGGDPEIVVVGDDYNYVVLSPADDSKVYELQTSGVSRLIVIRITTAKIVYLNNDVITGVTTVIAITPPVGWTYFERSF